MSIAHERLYVSTAIPYVNAPPHLGFALERVLADVLARHARLRGADVWHVTGTDENSLKNVRAADIAGVSTSELVSANAERYRALGSLLNLTNDDFVRTSVDPRHHEAARALWRACAADLEKRVYRGLYCVGCEQFYEASDLVEGRCPEHGTVPEEIEEENWFFRLSHYRSALIDALASGRLRVHPRERAREIARFVEGGLRDVSVSRSRARARDWGIAVPGDPSQVIYVWFDALANYLATLGWPGDSARVESHWRGARRVHVVGKGIARFHAVLWPALLLAAGEALPTDLWVHGYVTVGGEKIGKSRGNGVDLAQLVARYGADAIRYVLLRHVGPTGDADVDEARIARVYDGELADGLGNLVARVVSLARRTRASAPDARGERCSAEGLALVDAARSAEADVGRALDAFAPDEALRRIAELVARTNKHLADTAPWAALRARDESAGSAGASAADAHARELLAPAVIAVDAIGRALRPLLPAAAATIAGALADPSGPVPILFPKRAPDAN